MNQIIWVCCWCEHYLPHENYDYCPRCMGRFSFGKPVMLDLGAYI